MKNLLISIALLFETFVLKKVFSNHYKKKAEHEAFLKKFPCPHCRPDGCTFYWNIPCRCPTCGRDYHI